MSKLAVTFIRENECRSVLYINEIPKLPIVYSLNFFNVTLLAYDTATN